MWRERREGRLAGWLHRWWAGQAGLSGRTAEVAFWPAEQAYRGIALLRNLAYDRGWLRVWRSPIPVVSIGNLGVGGAGKTPVTAWLAARLAAKGFRPAIGLRGYGKDEVLLHRELNPTIPVLVAPRRIDAAREAAAAGRNVLVLDDAFQHRALARDLDIVLVPADGWSAKPRLLPRGPWREPLSALRRADLVLVTQKAVEDAAVEAARERLRACAPRVPVLACRLEPADLVHLHDGRHRPLEHLAGRPVFAVAALASPTPFEANLAGMGAMVELASFPDHHGFTPREAAELRRRAGARWLVMTTKDAVKLRPLLPSDTDAWVVRQRVCIAPDALARLDDLLGRTLEVAA